MAYKTPEERFFAKVRTDGPNGCHLWTGAKNVWGYGRIHRGGLMLAAHRVAWELANGAIPDGALVLHHCDNRGCVNPAHLYTGTAYDNMRDMVARNPNRTPRGPSFMKRHNPDYSWLEIRIPAKRRAELDAFADTLGLSRSNAVRLAITDMLTRRSVTVTAPPETIR